MNLGIRLLGILTVFVAILWSIYFSSSSSKFIHRVDRHRYLDSEPVTRITILTTNDLHSAGHKYESLSRYLRETQNEAIKKNHIVLTLDAGDWFSGSMYDRLSVSSSHDTPQLDYFSYSNYDAITLGNHEFDAGEEGLHTMLSSMKETSGVAIPILNADIEFRHSSSLSEFHTSSSITTPPSQGVRIQSSLIVSKGDLKIGILGVMGPDSALLCQHSRSTATFSGFSDSVGLLRFDRVVRRVRDVVRDLREKSDVVVLIAHSGGEEVEQIATSVADSGVDVVIGGHTHETQFHEIETESSYYDAFFSQPEIHRKRKVFLSQCGSDGEYVGKLDLDVFMPSSSSLGNVELRIANTTRNQIASSSSQSACIPYKDLMMGSSSSSSSSSVMKQKLSSWHDELSKILGRDPRDVVFQGMDGLLFSHNDSRSSVANIVADGILKVLNNRLSSGRGKLNFASYDCKQAEIYMTCPDCVRAFELPLKNKQFNLTFEEVYRMLSISVSKGIYVFHMKKSDLFLILELVQLAEVWISDTMKLSISSTMQFDQNTWGIPFVNRITNFSIHGVSYDDLDDFVCIAMNGYFTPYYFLVNYFSKGLLNNFPRNHKGKLLNTIEDTPMLVDALTSRMIPEYELFVEYIQSL